jgi:hypothetical protein
MALRVRRDLTSPAGPLDAPIIFSFTQRGLSRKPVPLVSFVIVSWERSRLSIASVRQFETARLAGSNATSAGAAGGEAPIEAAMGAENPGTGVLPWVASDGFASMAFAGLVPIASKTRPKILETKSRA